MLTPIFNFREIKMLKQMAIIFALIHPMVLEAKKTEEEKRKKIVLAEINGVKIKIEDFEREIKERPFIDPKEFANMNKRKAFLQRLIKRELLAQMARKRQLHKDPSIQWMIKRMMVNIMIRKDINLTISPSQITADEINQYYQEHYKDYHKPKMVRISHILVKDRALAQKIIKEANEKKYDMRSFAKLARKYSKDEHTRHIGGDLGYFSKKGERSIPSSQSTPLKLIKTAFSMKKIGDIYPVPIKTKQGFHIIRLSGRREEVKRSIKEMTPIIRNLLVQQRRKEAIQNLEKELKQKYKVKIYKENMKYIIVDIP
jgi:peptidyl-prolyl cis-trans isomerase C